MAHCEAGGGVHPINVIYQLFVFGTVYPGETIAVAVILAIVPYTLLRDPVACIVRRRSSSKDHRLDNDPE